MCIEKYVKPYSTQMYAIFRILVGLLFAQHGAQKLFGLFGGQTQPLLSLMGVAGIVELVGGILIAIGLFTRLSALVSGVQMLVAYFMAHAANGVMPIVNKGELALLYFAAMFVIVAFGNGRWALEQSLFGKERF